MDVSVAILSACFGEVATASMLFLFHNRPISRLQAAEATSLGAVGPFTPGSHLAVNWKANKKKERKMITWAFLLVALGRFYFAIGTELAPMKISFIPTFYSSAAGA